MDAAPTPNLPAGLVPVRYSIPDAAKDIMRGRLGPDEPIVLTISTEGEAASLIGTSQRLFVVKTGQMGTTAMGGSVTAQAQVREFPWEGITKLVMAPMTYNVRFSLHYRTSNGKTVEVGRRARLANAAVEHIAAFEMVAGEEAFAAMTLLWDFKRALAEANEA